MARYRKLNVKDFGEFDDKNYKDGVFTIRLSSWDEFHNVVKKFNNYPDYFWRGQEDQYLLLSSFDRKSSNNKDREKTLKRIFNDLKYSLMDINNNIDSLNSNEIWAIGQHYGFKTPLLDWTKSPYIAAYFAFYKKNEKQTVGSYTLLVEP